MSQLQCKHLISLETSRAMFSNLLDLQSALHRRMPGARPGADLQAQNLERRIQKQEGWCLVPGAGRSSLNPFAEQKLQEPGLGPSCHVQEKSRPA